MSLEKIAFEQGCVEYWGLTEDEAVALRARLATTPMPVINGPAYPVAFFEASREAGPEMVKLARGE